MKNFLVLLFAAVMLAGCAREPKRFIPPEEEYIFVPEDLPEVEYIYAPVAEPLGDNAWDWVIYWSPNVITPHTVFRDTRAISVFYDVAHKVNEYLEGRLFDEMGFPFHDEIFERIIIDYYHFDPGDLIFFNEDAEEIGVIRVWIEDGIPVRVEILTVEEIEGEGFFESVEVAAYVFGAEFRLPTENMEIYGEPMIAPFRASWWGESDRLTVMYEAVYEPDFEWRHDGVLIIYIEHFDGDIDTNPELKPVFHCADFCRSARSKNRRDLAGRKVFCDAAMRQKDRKETQVLARDWYEYIIEMYFPHTDVEQLS